MDRLIELLNEYVKGRNYCFVDYDRNMTWFNILLDWSATFLWEETVSSRNFWFIAWLWENDYLELPRKLEEKMNISLFLPKMSVDDEIITNYYILLAFSKEPIDLLCKQLKKWKKSQSDG